MFQFNLFRILTYVLVPISAFFGFMAVLMILPALANPPFLLVVFLCACMVIYVFSTLKFLTRGIERNTPCKPSLRDWIRVNAYVCMVTGFMIFLNSAGILMLGPVALRDFVTQALENQPNIPTGYDTEFFVGMIKIVAGCLLFISIILVIHIFINFRLMKTYRHVFDNKPEV